jgi:hypothetical protein
MKTYEGDKKGEEGEDIIKFIDLNLLYHYL